MARQAWGGADKMVKRIFLLLVIFSGFICSAQKLSTSVNDERIRSLRAYTNSAPLETGLPVLEQANSDYLIVEFDILNDDRDYLRYELLPCKYDWSPSQITTFEAIDGFNEGRIEDFAYSRATTVPYVHYRLELPNEDMKLKISGNYAIRIYDENDPETTLMTVCFAVSENTVPVSGLVTSRTDRDYNRQHQQLELTADFENTEVRDLYNEVFLVIEQNGRPDTRRVLTKPLRVSGRKIIYEHLDPLIFTAGNEYRRFETVSNTLTGMNVDAIEYKAPYYNHYLVTDQPRNRQSYLYDETLRGGYLIREYNSDESDIDADYVVVHFTLASPELEDTDIFIDTDAFQREFSPVSRMLFNRATGQYEKAALLKQGAYSYQYVAVPSGVHSGLTRTIEGDRYQTNNIYKVLVYYRRPGERYDRLIGNARFTSGQPVY